MSKVSNILTMLELLSSGRKYNIQELAEQLEVSKRMIRVYKEELEKSGIYLDSIKGPHGGYVLNQQIHVPRRFINQAPIYIEGNEKFNKLSQAIKTRKKVLIEYYQKDFKSTSKRIIEPYDLLVLNYEWGVAAYCELKKEIRHFYLNRIKELQILEEKY